MGCQEKKLTDFSYFLLLNSLRECNVNTYEFGKNRGNSEFLINEYLKNLIIDNHFSFHFLFF